MNRILNLPDIRQIIQPDTGYLKKPDILYNPYTIYIDSFRYPIHIYLLPGSKWGAGDQRFARHTYNKHIEENLSTIIRSGIHLDQYQFLS